MKKNYLKPSIRVVVDDGCYLMQETSFEVANPASISAYEEDVVLPTKIFDFNETQDKELENSLNDNMLWD